MLTFGSDVVLKENTSKNYSVIHTIDHILPMLDNRAHSKEFLKKDIHTSSGKHTIIDSS